MRQYYTSWQDAVCLLSSQHRISLSLVIVGHVRRVIAPSRYGQGVWPKILMVLQSCVLLSRYVTFPSLTRLPIRRYRLYPTPSSFKAQIFGESCCLGNLTSPNHDRREQCPCQNANLPPLQDFNPPSRLWESNDSSRQRASAPGRTEIDGEHSNRAWQNVAQATDYSETKKVSNSGSQPSPVR
jgi:hypothetical protein